MQAELSGEVRPIIRNRRGVVWCPFCDTSSVLTGDLLGCSSCRANFKDDVTEVVPPTPRRRRAVATEDDTSVPEMVVTEIPEEPAEE